MHCRNILSVILFVLSIFQFSTAQNHSKTILLQTKFNDFRPQRSDLTAENFFREMSNEMEFSAETRMKLSSTYAGNSGIQHHRFQQFHNDLPVIGNTFLLHEKNGNIVHTSGLYTPNISLEIHPTTTAAAAISKAQELLFAEIKEENFSVLPEEIKIIETPQLCIIDQLYPAHSGDMILAYQLDLETEIPLKKVRYYINAHNNNPVRALPLIHLHGVPSTGKTKYYGIQNVITDSIAPNEFLLKDITRGKGITVKNNAGDVFKNNSNNWDLTNIKRDEVALDALYCAEKYYDLLSERFDWQSLDGLGTPLNITVHNNSVGAVNAYWDGLSANFGDGSCIKGPLTTLEIVGHEFTHGLIQYTSQMVYSGEPGAINESIADMFGKSLEHEADPAGFSWGMGHSIHLKDGLLPFRRMDDPKSMGMPAFYKGQHWIDDNEVHFNSSIGNLWFVILSDGRTGINEAGEPFDVSGLGIEKAHQIVFLANNAYNISNTNYAQFAKNTLIAAEELYGINSPEWASVKEAWKAVGVPGNAGGPAKDLAISSPSANFNSCELNDFIPLTILVTNTGTETYKADSGARLFLYSLTNGIIYLPLDEDIISGATKITKVNNWIKYVGQEYESYNIIIEYDDDYEDNNSSLVFVNYKLFGQNDLAVNIYKSGISACKGNEQRFVVGIQNNSCDDFPAGENLILNFKNENGAIVWSKNIILDEPIAGGFFQYEYFDLELDFIDNRPYSIELIYDEDPDLSNNNFTIDLKPEHSLEAEYLQSFDDLPNNLGTLNIYSNYPFPTINYQNEKYLGFTGYYPDTSAREQCEYPEDQFRIPNKVIGSASICLNFPDAAFVTVEFDAFLFRNKFNELSPYPYSSMILVKWEGNESGSELIYDQEEGVKVHNSIALPSEFSGTLTFQFVTETGKINVDQWSMQNDDVILMDNLHIHTGAISASNKIEKTDELLFPNPCHDYLNVGKLNLTDFSSCEIINSFGNKSEVNVKNQLIDVSSKPAGIYYLKVVEKSGESRYYRFVKI